MTMLRKCLIALALIAMQLTNVTGQLKINEFLASNASVNVDPDYNANADWVELYNAGETAVNLNGYYLSDDVTQPKKWQITTSVSISAKGYLLIWTDGNNKGLHTVFKLSASGEQLALYNASGVMLDSVTFGPQNTDISYGRSPDGGSTWSYFQKPTPGTSNGTQLLTGQVDNSPEFRQKGGFFNAPVSVELFTDLGGTIRYTLDGAEPAESSPAYTSPLSVTKTTVVRARVFKPDQIPGPVVTQTYFLNEGFDRRKLPVVAISTTPANFWDSKIGIYVQTFKPEWEIPVNIELFENDGNTGAAFNERAGIKVNGLYSWQLPQKMLGVYFKKQYGESTLAYPLFFDRDRKTFKDFALRASGNDWSNTLFRDGLVQQACQNFNMRLDNMGFRPSIVYVNGQYMGIHNMREKVDEDYIASTYKLSKDSIDMIENESYAEAGSLDAYNAFKTLYSRDLSIQSNYDAVAAVMDIEEFTDLIVTELYDGNSSIDHNVMAWKPKGNGKWKWILMDLDRGFFSVAGDLSAFYIAQDVWPFSQLMKNAAYKQYFGTRLANHLFTTFNPIRMDKRIDYHRSLIEAEIPNHVARWLGATSSYGNAMPSVEYWNNEVAELKVFAEGRPAVLLTDLQKYGFSSSAELSLSVYPSNAGSVLFNHMTVPETTWSGLYPKNLPITLTAVDKPGFAFKGWSTSLTLEVISKHSEWKYLDNGSNQQTNWQAPGFNDASWKTGLGNFGYGDTQQTLISYGPSSSSKYITTYFRKTFNATESLRSCGALVLNVLRDDGAVVYLNGHEVVRSNMPIGTINYQTLSTTPVSGTDETTYFAYPIDPSLLVSGPNVIAVELHQNLANSSDLGFDLQLVAQVPDSSNLLSTSKNYTFSLSDNRQVTAIYQSRGQNLVLDTLTKNITFYKALSPYVLQGDLTIPANVTLTIEPGVEIYMAPQANLMVYGSMQALGNANNRIVFKRNPDYSDGSWGALCFLNATDTIRMSYVTVVDAGKGPSPIRDVAAISAFKSNLVLDHLTIISTDYDPIVTRYGSVSLTNSTLHSGIVGNLINVKNGKGYIEHCFFEGNDFPDTDAIDYDNVDNGVIKNSVIRNFGGSNSDGIDLGESSHVLIDSVLIYNIFDKGVSVGLRTSVTIKNVLIMNTTLGFGIKDSSSVYADSCTFYGVGTPVANYEKIVGRAGGNAYITNSIFSNSYNQSYSSDVRSRTYIAHSLSDNDPLPEANNNVFGNPAFNSPGTFDFGLQAFSPARLSGFSNGAPSDMGSVIRSFTATPYVLLSDIFYNKNKDTTNRTEFIAFYNPSNQVIDLSGYVVSEAVDFTFPQGTSISPGRKVLLAKNLSLIPDIGNFEHAWTWTKGSLSNDGETIRLSTKNGIIIDQVSYQTGSPWPDVSDMDERVLTVIAPALDNHFGENWKTSIYGSYVGIQPRTVGKFVAYPNPTRGEVNLSTGTTSVERVDVFTVQGTHVLSQPIQGEATIDLGRFGSGVYLVRIGNHVEKVIVLGNR